jgi:dTDP-4-amino-4,6-dideoxygalactose transaminase
MNVPLLDLKPQIQELREEILEKVAEVVDSTRYIMGPEVEKLEQEIARYSEADYGIGVTSGTDALLVALMTLGLKPGDRVLTTPYSFFATMGAIIRVGAEPVFADIDPVTYNIDPEDVERLLVGDSENTIKAIIPVHLYGQCCDMQRIGALSRQYGVPVIEDAAQAIGAEVPMVVNGDTKWHRAGSLGLAGCFSFFPSKNLGGIGDGGMLVTQDLDFAEKSKKMRNHGASPKYYHSYIGGNFRLDPIQAVVLSIKLKHLENWHRQRRDNAEIYNRLFISNGLGHGSPVSLPTAVFKDTAGEDPVRNYHIYNQYVVRVENRDELKSYLDAKKIGTEIYYPLALHQQECLQSLMDPPHLPHAEEAAESTLALPIYPELSLEMQEYVVKSIRDFYT